MSNDLNQCNFIGRVGKDIESRFMPDGKEVVNFSIAVGSQWKSKSGEKQESTEWVNLVAFDKLANICSTYLLKGSKIFASCKVKTRKWDDKEGNTRYTTEFIMNEMQMLSGKPEGGTTDRPAPANSAPAASKTAAKAGNFDSFDDDEVPF